MSAKEAIIKKNYKHGWTTDIEVDELPKGLDEGTVRYISAKKREPQFMLDFRLKAFAHWQKMIEPEWAFIHYPKINYQDIRYYSAPKAKAEGPKSLGELDPELLRTF